MKKLFENNTFKQLLKNKNVLYASAFIAMLVLGNFILSKNEQAIMLFLLTAILVRCYTANMILVFLIPVAVTMIFNTSHHIESFTLPENATTTTNATQQATTATNVQPTLSKTTLSNAIASETTDSTTTTAPAPAPAPAPTPAPAPAPAPAAANANATEIKAAIENRIENSAVAAGAAASEPQPASSQVNEQFTGQKRSSKVNYAETVADAYSRLDQLVGGKGIENLTNQTSELLTQQTKLVDTMKNLSPLMDKVRNLIGTFESMSPSNLINA